MNYKTIPQVARELQVSEDKVRRQAEAKGLLKQRIGLAWALSPDDVAVIVQTLGKPRAKKRREGSKGGRYARR